MRDSNRKAVIVGWFRGVVVIGWFLVTIAMAASLILGWRSVLIVSAWTALALTVAILCTYLYESLDRFLHLLSTLATALIVPAGYLLWAYEHGWAWLWGAIWMLLAVAVIGALIHEWERVVARRDPDSLVGTLVDETKVSTKALRVMHWVLVVLVTFALALASAGASMGAVIVVLVGATLAAVVVQALIFPSHRRLLGLNQRSVL